MKMQTPKTSEQQLSLQKTKQSDPEVENTAHLWGGNSELFRDFWSFPQSSFHQLARLCHANPSSDHRYVLITSYAMFSPECCRMCIFTCLRGWQLMALNEVMI